jgi:hypothetical protein
MVIICQVDSYNVAQAKARLSEILERVSEGEEILLDAPWQARRPHRSRRCPDDYQYPGRRRARPEHQCRRPRPRRLVETHLRGGGAKVV